MIVWRSVWILLEILDDFAQCWLCGAASFVAGCVQGRRNRLPAGLILKTDPCCISGFLGC